VRQNRVYATEFVLKRSLFSQADHHDLEAESFYCWKKQYGCGKPLDGARMITSFIIHQYYTSQEQAIGESLLCGRHNHQAGDRALVARGAISERIIAMAGFEFKVDVRTTAVC